MSLIHGVWLALSSTQPAMAAAEGSQPATFEVYMESAAQHLEADELHQAAKDYADAYVAMPPEVQVTELGQFAAFEGVRIHYEELWPKTKDLSYLRACRALAQTHIDDLDEARTTGRLVSEPRTEERYIRETLVVVEATLEAAEAVPPPSKVPLPVPAPEPKPRAHDQPPRNMLAISMVSVGTLFAVGGGVLIVDGLLFPRMIAKAKARQRAIDEMEGDLVPGDPDPPAYVAHEQKMLERRNAILIGGSISFAAGVVLVGLSSLKVVQKRRPPSTARLRVAPNGAGVTAMLRF